MVTQRAAGPMPGADHQLQVHAARHHQKADEDGPHDGFPVEALLKMRPGF
jgi:hypothetical protein